MKKSFSDWLNWRDWKVDWNDDDDEEEDDDDDDDDDDCSDECS